MSLAEFFQITVPVKEEAGEQWASFESQRKINHDYVLKQNHMPPGMNSQSENNFPFVLAGCSDVTCDNEPAAMVKGYSRKGMKGTDDQYSGEHIDLFYSEAVDEAGNVGFCERNNMLDRM